MTAQGSRRASPVAQWSGMTSASMGPLQHSSFRFCSFPDWTLLDVAFVRHCCRHRDPDAREGESGVRRDQKDGAREQAVSARSDIGGTWHVAGRQVDRHDRSHDRCGARGIHHSDDGLAVRPLRPTADVSARCAVHLPLGVSCFLVVYHERPCPDRDQHGCGHWCRRLRDVWDISNLSGLVIFEIRKANAAATRVVRLCLVCASINLTVESFEDVIDGEANRRVVKRHDTTFCRQRMPTKNCPVGEDSVGVDSMFSVVPGQTALRRKPWVAPLRFGAKPLAASVSSTVS
ncbi:hypothetical protein LMG27952_07500 [Paraburkholderia hiiakae]|uniref:Uncharacterized protein n=1 Tax=Paraburkholderia hiiakae TaxID=1081782 RepID=A0ABN7IFJ4_9BURK|nr:hypothetical protein LMG27952_07500 [Paraburkholderia hiiakae]